MDMPKPKKGSVINPLMLIDMKSKPDQESVDKIHLSALIALDACKRGKCPNALANAFTEHLMVGLLLWAKQGNAALYGRSVEAWNAFCKALQRPTVTVDLTTTEYQAIRRSLQYYLRAIPQMEIGLIAGLYLEARKRIERNSKIAEAA
jgi:hypothetical protein